MDAYAAGWLSLIPPIVAIGGALATKEVFSSLFLGILSGAAIYCFGSGIPEPVIKTVDVTFSMMAKKVDFEIIIFCSLLGALIYLLNASGGTRAYAAVARKKIKSRRMSLLATLGLGLVIFIDDYLNCLSVGTVMHPITDEFRVSRAKLAYIVDSTAAPVCVIAPLSSWGAAIGSNLKTTGAFQSEFDAFVQTIPFNFYALFALMLVFYLCWTQKDFGPMKAAEEAALSRKPEETADSGTNAAVPTTNGSLWDMVLPLVCLIGVSALGLLYTGGYWGSDPEFHTIGKALGNSSASKALIGGSFVSLVVCLVLYVPRRLMSFKDFMGGFSEGLKLMLPANVILILAWALSGVCRDLLQIQVFVGDMIAGSNGLDLFLPAVIFVVAGLLSFATGASWATFGILIPVAVPLAQAVEPALLIPTLSAVLAGSVFGDHCSPISDTTILSAAGAGCPVLRHASTQMPYAWSVAGCCLIGYLATGFTRGSWIAGFGATAVVFLGLLLWTRRGALSVKAFAEDPAN